MNEVLTCINLIRSEQNLSPVTEMLKGIPKSLLECPISKTLSAGAMWYVSASPISIYMKPLRVRVPFIKIKPVPKILVQFMNDFDRGLYPTLEM